MTDSVLFTFYDGDNAYLVEADYEADDGRPIIGGLECHLLDDVTMRPKVLSAKFAPSPLFIQERVNKRLTGKIIPLKEAIERKAFDKAQEQIDERLADAGDAQADAAKDAPPPAETE